MKTFVMLFGMMIAVSTVYASPESLQEYLSEARRSANAENYQNALKLYKEAQVKFPTSAEPSKALGDLYTQKNLYRLALESYEDVLKKTPGDIVAWLNVAQTYGYLNDNVRASDTYKKALNLFPRDPDLSQSLAWMNFKTEDYRQGIRLLDDVIKDRGTNRNIEMTLGTLYSSLLEYDKSRLHYLKSIELAMGMSDSDTTFRAIAWYNLSLLEKSFYQFPRSQDAIQNSLKNNERSSGYLALGELMQSRLDFQASIRTFEKAEKDDDTPLSLYDLAKVYQEFGFLDEALATAKKIEEHRDDSWIYNFGVTREKFQRDLHQLYRDIWKAKANAVDFERKPNPWEWLQWLFKKISFSLQGWYHDQMYKTLLVKLSESSLQVSNSPEAWSGLILANHEYPAAGLKYVALSKAYEVPKNPLSLPSYLKEEGIIRKDPALLKKALATFQTDWQNEEKMETLQTLIPILKGSGPEGYSPFVEQLFKMNPGALLQTGVSLPVQYNVYGKEEAQKVYWTQEMRNFAASTGWDISEASRSWTNNTLNLQTGTEKEHRLHWTLRDADGMTVRQGTVDVVPEHPDDALNVIFRQIHSPK